MVKSQIYTLLEGAIYRKGTAFELRSRGASSIAVCKLIYKTTTQTDCF